MSEAGRPELSGDRSSLVDLCPATDTPECQYALTLEARNCRSALRAHRLRPPGAAADRPSRQKPLNREPEEGHLLVSSVFWIGALSIAIRVGIAAWAAGSELNSTLGSLPTLGHAVTLM